MITSKLYLPFLATVSFFPSCSSSSLHSLLNNEAMNQESATWATCLSSFGPAMAFVSRNSRDSLPSPSPNHFVPGVTDSFTPLLFHSFTLSLSHYFTPSLSLKLVTLFLTHYTFLSLLHRTQHPPSSMQSDSSSSTYSIKIKFRRRFCGAKSFLPARAR